MDLGLSVGTPDSVERTVSMNRDMSLDAKDAAARDAEVYDHPSLQLELKLPCSGDSYAGRNGQILNHSHRACEAEPSSVAAPLSITAERPHWRSCDEDDGIGKATRKKLRLTKEQSCYLEQSFKQHPTLNPKQKVAIARNLNLQPRQVEVWFQNRRARTKLKQTEMDFEHLKQRCESLALENQKLQRELEELKALKSPPPHLHLHSPIAMLALCPSCERSGTPEMAGKKLGGLLMHVKHGENFHPKLAYQVG